MQKVFKFLESRFWAYFILSARVLLAFQFISFGSAKLLEGGQFGISETELKTPLQDLSLFKVMWYLFDHEPFKTSVGFFQCLCGILLLFNRTVILGAILFIPIAVNILIIDISFMLPNMVSGFASRLIFYLVLNFMILYHYKDNIAVIIKEVLNPSPRIHKFKIGYLMFLPISGLLISFIPVIPVIIFYLFKEPEQMTNSLLNLWNGIVKMINNYLK